MAVTTPFFGASRPTLHIPTHPHPQAAAAQFWLILSLSMRAHQQRSPWSAATENETSLVAVRRAHEATHKFKARLASAKPCIDTTPPTTMVMPHLALRLKKKQLQQERAHHIVRDNQKLLDKMTTILCAGVPSGQGAAALTSVTSPPESFALLHRSKHERVRRQAAEKVERENAALLARLEKARPRIEVAKMEEDYARRTAQRAPHSKAAMRTKVAQILHFQEKEEEEEEEETTAMRALAGGCKAPHDEDVWGGDDGDDDDSLLLF